MNQQTAHLNAAAAGRLIVTLLFVANAVLYVEWHGVYALVGMTAAMAAAALGYFACSASAFYEETKAQKLIACSIVACLLSGLAFLVGG